MLLKAEGMADGAGLEAYSFFGSCAFEESVTAVWAGFPYCQAPLQSGRARALLKLCLAG